MPKNTKRKKQRLSKTSTKICIIGTGPASLSTALSLQQAGFTSIAIYERDAHFSARKDGYGLTLTYNPSSSIQSPLTKLGLLETLARMDCPSRAHYVFNSKGTILGYYGNAFSNTGWKGQGQRGNLRVPRQVLRKVMMDSLLEKDDQRGHVTVEWGKKLVSFDNNCVVHNAHNDKGQGAKVGDHNSPITLHFEDGSSTSADLLVGADGVRSTVIETLLGTASSSLNDSLNNGEQEHTHGSNSHSIEKNAAESPNVKDDPSDLTYTGIMIILGITQDFYHPLLDERGFYTLDGNHRLFTMPFEGSKISDLEQYNVPLQDSLSNVKRSRRYMWQLSFNLSHQDAITLSKGGSHGLLTEVLKRTAGWHAPVQEMMQSTPIDTIWGTPLLDRDPQKVWEKLQEVYKQKTECMRTVVMGDAMHPMTPFKGQGCNQSLMDGPLLCTWLERSNLDAAVKGFMREMVQRTRKKVLASREAAKFFHSDTVLEHEESFAGVKDVSVKKLLGVLNDRGIGASLGESLDDRVADIIQELGLSSNRKGSSGSPSLEMVDTQDYEHAKVKALEFAKSGNTAEIRKLSMSPCGVKAICTAKLDATGETILHLAAKSGCYHTVRWLLSETCADANALDNEQKTPFDTVRDDGDARIVGLLEKWNQ
jgi:2-polyprenyl-6-methoxyphenol hydroxylase-like FAD-dependent oxidoreductase